MDYSFSEVQVLQYLHEFLDGEAKCFQTDEAGTDFNNYEQAMHLFQLETTKVLPEKTRFDIK